MEASMCIIPCDFANLGTRIWATSPVTEPGPWCWWAGSSDLGIYVWMGMQSPLSRSNMELPNIMIRFTYIHRTLST